MLNTLSFKQVTSCSRYSTVTLFNGADIKVEVANIFLQQWAPWYQRSRWHRLCSTDSEQPGYTAEVVIWPCINWKGWKTLKKNIKSKENSSSDVTCVNCFDSYLESKENEDWIQCIVCKNWFHLNCVNSPPTGRFICLNCDSDDSD